MKWTPYDSKGHSKTEVKRQILPKNKFEPDLLV